MEAATIEALSLFGFRAKPFEDAESAFDAVFESPEGRCLGEVEGKDNRSINIDKLRQLEGTVKLSRIRPFCGRILLDQRLRINDLAVAAGGENAAKLLNLTVPFRARIAAR